MTGYPTLSAVPDEDQTFLVIFNDRTLGVISQHHAGWFFSAALGSTIYRKVLPTQSLCICTLFNFARYYQPKYWADPVAIHKILAQEYPRSLSREEIERELAKHESRCYPAS